jgi:drug/metabolite transporter (DMT)-like permease
MNSYNRSVFFLLFAVFLFSTSGVLIKISTWDALALNGARSLIAVGVIWAWLRKPNFTWSRAQIGGAIAYALMIITFVQATKWTTAANAIFLQFTAPLWVALFSVWLLGERPRRIDWITMAAIAVGMVLFFGDNLSSTGYWGNVTAIFSGVCMALMIIALRKQKDGSATETALLGSIIAFVLGIPFMFDEALNLQEAGIILYLGAIQLAIPFIILTQAIRYLRALETSLIQSLEPILNPIWVFLLLGETPGTAALIGAAIVTLAVLLRAIALARQGKPTPQPVA